MGASGARGEDRGWRHGRPVLDLAEPLKTWTGVRVSSKELEGPEGL